MVKRKKKNIKKIEGEYITELENSLTERRLFEKIIIESYKKILENIKEDNTFRASNYVSLIDSLKPQKGRRDFRLVMDVLNLLSRN